MVGACVACSGCLNEAQFPKELQPCPFVVPVRPDLPQ